MGEVRLIDANALRDLVSDMLVLKEKYGANFDILSVIDNAPTILEKSQDEDEWIDYDNTFYKCPDCGYLLEKDCPQCGKRIVLPNYNDKGGDKDE